jgi:ABC-2 type transport system permease protein
MIGSVFKETLRQTWVQMVYWGVGIGVLAGFGVLFVPLMDALDIVKFLETLPPVLLAAVGVGDDLEFLATTEGLVGVMLFGKMLMIFAAYPVVMGLRVTVNEEDSGTMDVLLSLPIARRQVIIEKFLAYLVTIMVISLLAYIGISIGLQIANVTVDMGRLAVATMNMLPMMTFVLASTILIGAFVNRKKLALGIATAFVMGSFMLNNLGEMAGESSLGGLRAISFFTYYDNMGVMKHGLIWPNVMGLLTVSVLLIGVSLWAFQRRDVGT